MAESYQIGIELNFDEREAEQLKKLPEEVRRRWESLNAEIQKGAPLEGARAGLLQQSSVRLQELGQRASAQGFVTPQQSAESQRLLAQQQRIWKGHWDEQERIAKQGSARLLDEIDRLQKEINQAERQGDTQRQQQLGRQLVTTYQQYERGGEDTAARVEEIRKARRFQQGQFEETRAQFQMFPVGEFVSPQRQERAQERIQRQQEREERAQAAAALGGQARTEKYQRDLQTRQEREEREGQRLEVLQATTGLGGQARGERYGRDVQTRQERTARMQERQAQRSQREQERVERLEEQAQDERLRAATAQIRAAKEAARATQTGTPLARAQAAHEHAQAGLVQAQAQLTTARAAVAADPFAQSQLAAARATQTAAQAQAIHSAEALALAHSQQPDPTQRRGGMPGFGFLGSFGRGLLGASVIGGGGYLLASRVRRDFSEELQRGMGVADLSQRLRPGGMPYEQFRDFAGAIHPTASPQESTEFFSQYSGLAGIRNQTPQQMIGRTTEAFGLTRAFGFAPEEGAKLFGGAERMGVDQRRLAETMGTEIARAQMRGREGEMFDAVIRMSESLVERLGRAPDIDRIAGVLGRLGESGMPGLQGTYGAQRVQGFEQAVQGTSLFNMPDLRTPVMMEAMLEMGVRTPGEMLRVQQQGVLARPDLARSLFETINRRGGIESDFGTFAAQAFGLPIIPEQFRAMERALTTTGGQKELERLKGMVGEKEFRTAFERSPYEVVEVARRAETLTPEKAREALGGFAEERRPEVAVRQELADLYRTEAAMVRLAIPAYAKAIQSLNRTGEVVGDFNSFVEGKLREQGFTPTWAERGADAATLGVVLGGLGVGWKGLKAGWGVLSKGLGGGFTSGEAVEAATRNAPLWRKLATRGVAGGVAELLFPSETGGLESELTPTGSPRSARNMGALLGAATPPLPAWLAKLHRQASQKYGIPPEVGRAIQLMENQKFDPNAVSSAGAIGMMQVMPGMYGKTAEELRDPETNIDTAYQLMTELKYRFRGDWGQVMGAYEYGEPKYRKLIAAGKEMTPYREKAEAKLAAMERVVPAEAEPRPVLTPEIERLAKPLGVERPAPEPRSPLIATTSPMTKITEVDPGFALPPELIRLMKVPSVAPRGELTPAAQRLMKATGVEPRGELTPEQQRLTKTTEGAPREERTPEQQRLTQTTEGAPRGERTREKADALLAATLAAMERARPEQHRLTQTAPRGDLTPEQQRLTKMTEAAPHGNLTPEMQRLMKAESPPKPAPLTEAIRMAKEAQQMQIGIAPLTIVVRNDRGEVIGTTTAQPEIRPIGDYGAPTSSPTAVVR